MIGDEGIIDSRGYFHVKGRIDDVINVAGHRLDTGRIEEVVNMHPQVGEGVVIGLKDDLKGEVPYAFIIVKSQTNLTPELKQEIAN